MENLPNQIGYLVMKGDGAVLESGGDLKNDERSANILLGLLQITDSVDENFMPNNSCERITITYDDHSYNISMSNHKIYVVKFRNMRSSIQSNGNFDTEGIGNTVTA